MAGLAIAFLTAGALGWVRAGRRGGGIGDKVQFALAHAIPATLAMLLFQVLVLRLGFGLGPDLFAE